MKNMTKMLLSSAILATSPIAMGATGADSGLTNNQIIENDGVINITGSFTLNSTAEGAYLDNYGEINYNRKDDEKLKLNGPADSGIRIYTGTHFRNMKGMVPTALLLAQNSELLQGGFADLMQRNYIKLSEGGKFTVKTLDADPVVLSAENLANAKSAYFTIGESSSDITINSGNQSFYEFLSAEGNNDAKNVIVLRGKETKDVELNNSTDEGEYNEENLFAVKTAIADNGNYLKTFSLQTEPAKTITLGDHHNLSINGYFDFKAGNELFNDGKVSIDGGVSQISSVYSMFQTNVDVKGGRLILDPQCERFNGDEKFNEANKTITLSKTMNVFKTQEPSGPSIVNKGKLVIGVTGVLNLGIAGE